MTEPLKESIQHLDWVVECGMSDNGVLCSSAAVFFTERHIPQACRHPVTNVDGNIEKFVCETHLASMRADAARVARRYNPNRFVRWWTSRAPVCPSCGRPLQHAGDVLQTVQKLQA